MRAMMMIAMSFAFLLALGQFSHVNGFEWLSPSEEKGNLPKDLWLINILSSVLVFAVPALVYTNIFPMERFGYFRLNKKVSVVTVLLGTLALVLLIPAFDMIISLIENSISNPDLVDLKNESDKLDAWATQMPGIGSLFFCIFANALVPAICEELFFRAGIQQILIERTRFKHFAIIGTALIFTFFHLDPFGIPVEFTAGLILGYAFYRTGSLRMTIVMHFIYNATELIIIYLNQHSTTVKNYEFGWGLVIPTVLMALVSLFFFWRRTETRL
jgi:membrane protease YdiL (CAAX protease family)